MATLGKGSQSSIGFGTETTPGVAVAPTVYPPVKSESLQYQRTMVPSGSLTNSSQVSNVSLGIAKIAGGITAEVGGALDGQMMFYWNGSANGGYTPTSFTALGFNTTSPTATVAAGGTLAVGTYRYKVAAVFSRGFGGSYDLDRYTVAVSTATNPTTSSGNQTVNLSWTNPTAAPISCTFIGTAIFRSAAGGAANTERFLAFVSGAGTTYSDTGSVSTGATAMSTNIASTAVLYEHKFLPTNSPSGQDRLKTFSLHMNKDTPSAERYSGCMMNEISFTAGGEDNIVEMSCSLMGRGLTLVSPTSPTVQNSAPILGWAAAGFIDEMDAPATCLWMNSFNIQCTNNVTEDKGTCMAPEIRGLASGVRNITGSFTRAYENHNMLQKLLLAQAFSIQFMMDGESVTPLNAWFDRGSNQIVTPWHNTVIIDLFECRSGSASGPINGQEQIVETVNFQAYKNATYNADMRVRYYNAISSYA